uniref:SCAN box domain-containing protein n=1 Tax=Knipowitschia caucasica TaxID=637954 RepID=A0AAV2IYQ5_KNICA
MASRRKRKGLRSQRKCEEEYASDDAVETTVHEHGGATAPPMSELVVLMKDFMQVPSGETPTETYHRLKSLYRRWVRPDQLTKEQIGELVIMEQLLRVLPPNVRTWVREHEPEDGLTAARLALQHQNARRGGPPRFTSSAPRSSQTSAPNFRVREGSQDTRGKLSSASTQPATAITFVRENGIGHAESCGADRLQTKAPLGPSKHSSFRGDCRGKTDKIEREGGEEMS